MFVFVVYDLEAGSVVSVHKTYDDAALKKQEHLTLLYPGRELGFSYTITIQRTVLED